MDLKDKLAQRNAAVHWSGIRIIFEWAAKLEQVINLGLGEPDFDTPAFIRDAAKKALDEGYTRYPPSAGYRDLREAVASKLKKENGIEAHPDTEIFISIGAMQGIFNTLLHLLNPGDEVIVADPGYDYFSQIRVFGGVPVAVPVYEANRFQVDPADLQKAITPRTKLLILNSPANPTGAVLERAVLEEIAGMVQRHGLLVLSDEPYEKIIFDGREHVSIGSLEGMKDHTISVYTLSKTYAMPGWRVGYVAAPSWIIQEMEKIMEHLTSGVTSVVQRAALAAILGPQECVQEMAREYERRRDVICQGLNGIEGISCVLPAGAFYAFPNISRCGKSSWDFAKYLLQEHRVATIPGSIFGDRGEGYLRISFAAHIAVLKEAVSRIGAAVRSLGRGGVQ